MPLSLSVNAPGVINDFQKIALSSRTPSSRQHSFEQVTPPRDQIMLQSLSSSHSLSPYHHHSLLFDKPEQDLPITIDTFAPRPISLELSPATSDGSEYSCSTSHTSSSTLLDAFMDAQSRVIRISPQSTAVSLLSPDLRTPTNQDLGSASAMPTPTSMWTIRGDYDGHQLNKDSIWAVFNSHAEAYAALVVLSKLAKSVAPALEAELEPFHKLRRFDFNSAFTNVKSTASTTTQLLHMSLSSASDLRCRARDNLKLTSAMLPYELSAKSEYTLSTNPPNPRSNFRLGDWICNASNCSAHNFGRNLACIGCGCSRSSNGQPQAFSSVNVPSPRFVSSPSYPPNFSVIGGIPAQSSSSGAPVIPQPQQAKVGFPSSPALSLSHPQSTPKSSAHPLLTPSGRAFASGGKVQNISADPLTPCVMYWPDNEPFPEQVQIRPSSLVNVAQPPILNTGNRGPIEHQPGDWICLKCNYLNWRRRKVCQTCFPYAEGNGDSISAAVQSERIALLTSVLAQAQSSGQFRLQPAPTLQNNVHHQNYQVSSVSHHQPNHHQQQPRTHSLTPPHYQHSFGGVANARNGLPPRIRGSVQRSQSYAELGELYASTRPIYQTSPNNGSGPITSQSSPYNPEFSPIQLHPPAPLLPSFLQDIVQSPTASPASTSSASLSFEEYSDIATPPTTDILSSQPPLQHHSRPARAHLAPGSGRGDLLSVASIWSLDGDESKSMSSFALPTARDFMGNSRKSSLESQPRSNILV